MGKSKKSKFSIKPEGEILNDESSIVKNKKQNVENKTPLPPQNAETSKTDKTVQSPIDVVAGTGSVKKNKSKKRKRELVDESVSPSVEEATNLDIETKEKEKHLVNEDDGNVEESETGPKAKKRKLKKPNVTGNVSHEQKQKPKKTSKNDDSDNEDSRNSRTIFIGNVPVKYNKKALAKLLNEKGNLMRYWTRGFIPRSDKISKKTAAIANLLSDEHPPLIVYALFQTAADAKNALTLNGAIFEDHRLRVTHSETKECSAENGVFVGNLPFNITDDDLYDFFNQCGKIVSTRVMRSKEGKARGFAFVNFESADSVELALKMNEEKLRDREIRVTRMKNKRQIEKMQKRKAVQATKDISSNKKHKPNKTESSPDKSNNFQKKKKKVNSAEFKKKVLAGKLTSTTKRKEKESA